MYQKDNANAYRISLKLNKINDADIIQAIGEKQKQTIIKMLVRKGMERENER
jgi:hypothetical protein